MLNALSNISLYTPYRSKEEWRKALLSYNRCTKLCHVYGHFHTAATIFLGEGPTETNVSEAEWDREQF